MPLLEGGCAWGAASALLRVPGFPHGLPLPPAPFLFCLSLLCLRKRFWEVLGFLFPLGSAPGSLWGWNTLERQRSRLLPGLDSAVEVMFIGTEKAMFCPKLLPADMGVEAQYPTFQPL